MNTTAAENLVTLINAAMELTASLPQSVARGAVGLDLDIVAGEQGRTI
jgi:hypothetical protein